MNIKSLLLLGSAVASVSFTGAQAADAIFVPEPEPMEYVRVCDVYGAGFFYIPGTETCLKIGGYVRYQINMDEGDNSWKKRARANINFDARSETEYGTLRGYAELWFQRDTSNTPGYTGSVRVRQAFIELGGLYFGNKVTLWDGDLAGEYDDWGFSDEIHTVGYNFAFGNGVNLALGVEKAGENTNYRVNVVGKLGISQGWGSVNVWGGYDADDKKWNAKAIGEFKLADPLTLQVAAAYASGANRYAPGGDYKWAAGAHLKYKVTDKLAVGFGGEYFGKQYGTNNNDWAIGGVVDYEVVKGFATKLAVNYYDGDSYSSDANHWGGFLRLQRNF